MNRALMVAVAVCIALGNANGQPMSGEYRIGGSAPDFTSFQEAADALKADGVSGPVTFNIRPGVYMENNGNNTVLHLDTVVAGVSPTNRVTFQPDAAAGGNVDNVILRFNRTDPPNADRDLVIVQLDFVTIRNLTLDDIDSSHTFDNHLIRLLQLDSRNPTIDGFTLEGCKLIGTTHIQSSSTALGTDFGIGSLETVTDVTIRGNTFIRLLRAISLVNGSGVAQTITVEDNQITEGYRSMSGTGNFLGAGIEISCNIPSVRRNVVDLTGSLNGGWQGIFVYVSETGEIEQNMVLGPTGKAIHVTDFAGSASFVLIANNMIASGYTDFGLATNFALRCEVDNALIVHNSVVVPEGTMNVYGLSVRGTDCSVLNNLVHDYANGAFLPFVVAYDLGGSGSTPNLRSDYNVFDRHDHISGGLVFHEGIYYQTLGAFQDSTGLDTNTISIAVDYLDLSTDLHLTDCQSADPLLAGIPVPEVPTDFDGEGRSLTAPTRGADETPDRAVPMFGEVFRIDIPGFITDLASGNFDNLLVDGLAVADLSNSQVHLYHSNPSTRSFTLSQSLSPGFAPTNVKLFDLDDDGNLDVVVSGDTSLVHVYWGDGGGGFSSETSVEVRLFLDDSHLPVVALDTGAVSTFVAPDLHTVLLSCGLRTMPVTSFLGYLDNSGGRDELQFVVIQKPSPNPPSPPDSIAGILRDIIGGDIDGDGDPEVASILASGVTTDFVVFDDTNAVGGGGFHAFGTHYDYHFGTAGYSATSSLVAGHFDADDDLDFLTTAVTSSQVLFLRNEGGFGFTAEPVSTNSAFGIASLDYNGDGDLDFATVNLTLQENGVTVFLNDGFGNFTAEFTCFEGLGTGAPQGILASDFDLDGMTDLAVASTDSVFILYNSGGGISTVRNNDEGVPDRFVLEQNYPNPFNPNTVIRFRIARQGKVELKIYNLLGEEVAVLVNEVKDPGAFEVKWDATRFASGVYFSRMQYEGLAQTKKLLLIK